MRKKTVVQIALGAALCMAAGGLLAFGRVQRDEGVKFRERPWLFRRNWQNWRL